MKNTKIEWCDHTWNPWIGCTKVSAGCKNCFAEDQMAKRWKRVEWGPLGERKRTSDDYWRQPFRWDADAYHRSTPFNQIAETVFVGSLCDIFENRPELVEWRDRALGIMRSTDNLIYLLLTKRPENVMAMVPKWWKNSWPGWVWIGTSIESHTVASSRLLHLSKIPGKHFVSAEPLIEPMVPFGFEDCIDWMIVGGETGRTREKIRPMNPFWARELRDWSADHHVPFFMKQMGAWRSWDQKSPIGDSSKIVDGSIMGKDGIHIMVWHGGHGDGDAIPADLRIQQSPFKRTD